MTTRTVHLFMPCGEDAVCNHFADLQRNSVAWVFSWSEKTVTCRACLSRVKKHPQLRSQILAARQTNMFEAPKKAGK